MMNGLRIIVATSTLAIATATFVAAPQASADSSCSNSGNGGTSYAVSCSRGPGKQYQAFATCHYNLFPWDDAVKTGGWTNYGKGASLVSCGWNHSSKNGGVSFR